MGWDESRPNFERDALNFKLGLFHDEKEAVSVYTASMHVLDSCDDPIDNIYRVKGAGTIQTLEIMTTDMTEEERDELKSLAVSISKKINKRKEREALAFKKGAVKYLSTLNNKRTEDGSSTGNDVRHSSWSNCISNSERSSTDDDSVVF